MRGEDTNRRLARVGTRLREPREKLQEALKARTGLEDRPALPGRGLAFGLADS